MALKRKSIRGQFGAATAVLLAASPTLTRYVRGYCITSDVASQQTFNLAFASTATVAGPGVFGAPISPFGTVDRGFPGYGARLDNVAISGFASAAASVSYEIEYDESDTTDA